MPRLLFVLFALVFTASGQSIATNSAAPLSTRVVDYRIDAHVDPAHHMLDATESLTYRNLTGEPLSQFPLHLYLNAFQPDSTFTAETHFSGGIRDSESEDLYPDRKRGSITLTRLTADGFGDLLPTLRFLAPDDANANDRTVAQVTLPRPLGPGESVTFRFSFRDVFPESVARNGYKRDFLMGGQWYPKLGVFLHGAWNCHQYHATTEFFSDFATFDVRLTLPANYIVGASGVPTGSQANADGTRTLGFRGEDIHDFAWAASPHFTTLDANYQSALGPVLVHVLALAAHPAAGPRYRDILLASLKQFEQRYGPYPYKILTLIDPEPGSEIGGMEYPTLVTGDASLLDPTFLLEETAEHEFGHQYWYGMVATNEFEDAWLDEGINSYTEAKVLAAILGTRTSFFSQPWANFSDLSAQYLEYIAVPNYDPVARHAWQFHNADSYGGVTYGKSSMLLSTLEGIVGHDTMDEAMRVYFQRFRFQHPTTEDFLSTIEEVAISRGKATGVPFTVFHEHQSNLATMQQIGQENMPSPFSMPPTRPVMYAASSLRQYLNQAVYGTAILDYAVDKITYTPAKWWLAENDPKQDKLHTSTVTIHRIGDFLLPVELEVTFSDGSKSREHWDPSSGENDRWHTFSYTREPYVTAAEIDPQHTVVLDVDRFNNSRTVAADKLPGRKLSNLWLSALQAASQFAGWLV